MSSTEIPIPSAGRPLSPGAVALMLMLCLSWGFNQIAVKLALPDVPPMLQALLSSHRPLGAYEVIDELAKSMPRPAPITVYRALDFLIENGLVHRIESRNAFLACAHDHDAAAMVAFLICEHCGSVGEIPDAPVAQSLNAAARSSGFTPKLSVVEITGTCAHCQE